MTDKTKSEGLINGKNIAIVLLLIFTVLSVVFSDYIFGEGSIFNSNPTGIAIIDWLWQHIPLFIDTIRILFVSWLLIAIICFVIDTIDKAGKKTLTALRLLKSFLKYAIFIAAIFIVLTRWGVDTTTLLASAGILTLVVGLGAQSLIADILAGIFTVFEGEYEVGDIIVVDGWRGVVQEIGLRTTKIMDINGNVQIINNSAISNVINQTKQLSIARCYVEVESNQPLEWIELVIRDNLPAIKANIPQIINGPYYKGVDEFSANGITLLFTANCNENDVYLVQRSMNREFKIMFDYNGVSMPFPQFVIHQPEDFGPLTVSEEDQIAAREFSEQQKIISKAKDISE